MTMSREVMISRVTAGTHYKVTTSLVVTLRTYISIAIYRPIYRQNSAIFDSPYYLLATISDHIPRKRYHQHNEMKSANSLFCQYFQAFVEILLCNVVQRWSICLISYVETQYISTGVGIKKNTHFADAAQSLLRQLPLRQSFPTIATPTIVPPTIIA